jgi:predicted Zn-dependent peptidase
MTSRVRSRRWVRAGASFGLLIAMAWASWSAGAQVIPAALECVPASSKPDGVQVATPKTDVLERVELHRRAGVTSFVFASGVRVHVRPMESSSVTVRAVIAGVQAREDDGTRGLALLAGGGAALDLPTAKVSVGPDGISVSWNGSTEDLPELAASLGRALVAPEFKHERFEQARLRAITIAQATSARGAGRMMRELATPQLLALMPEPERIAGFTFEQAQRFATEAFAQCLVDIAVTGPVEPSRIGELFGSHIPASAPRVLARGVKLDPPAPGREVRTIAGGEATTVLVMAMGPPAGDLQGSRRSTALARIIDARLGDSLKERAIDPSRRSVTSLPARWGNSAGGLIVQVRLKGESEDRAKARDASLSAIEGALESLRRDGPSEPELMRVRESLAQQADARAQDPAYWASVLASCRESGVRIDDLAGAGEKIRAITIEQVRDCARDWLAPERLRIVTIEPE